MSLEERIMGEFSQQNLKTYFQKGDIALRDISSGEKLVAHLHPSLGDREDVSIENFIGNGGRQNIYKIRINGQFYAASIRKTKITELETEQKFSLGDINGIEGIIPTFGLIRTKRKGKELFYGTIAQFIEKAESLYDYIITKGPSAE